MRMAQRHFIFGFIQSPLWHKARMEKDIEEGRDALARSLSYLPKIEMCESLARGYALKMGEAMTNNDLEEFADMGLLFQLDDDDEFTVTLEGDV